MASSAVAVTTVGVLPVHLVGVLAVQVRTDLGLGPADLGPLAAAFSSTSAGADGVVRKVHNGLLTEQQLLEEIRTSFGVGA